MNLYGRHLIWESMGVFTFPCNLILDKGEKKLWTPKNWQIGKQYTMDDFNGKSALGLITGLPIFKDYVPQKEVKNVIVIDVDHEDPLDYLETLGVPRDIARDHTLSVSTPRKHGVHKYYLLPSNKIFTNQAHISIGGHTHTCVDVRGTGGFVFASGSRFSNILDPEFEYTDNIDSGAGVEPLPQFWYDVLNKKETVSSFIVNGAVDPDIVDPHRDRALGKLEAAIAHGLCAVLDPGRDRSAYDFAIACAAIRAGKSDEEIKEILLKQPKCRIRLAGNRTNQDRYCDCTIKNAKKELLENITKNKNTFDMQSPLDEIMVDNSDSSSSKFFDFITQPHPVIETEYLIPGAKIFPRKGVTILGGASYSGKSSLLVRSICVPMCHGDLALGTYHMPKVKTLYIQSDMTEAAFKAKALDPAGYDIAKDGETLTFVHIPDLQKLPKNLPTILGLIQECIKRGYEWIILDNRTTLFIDSVYGKDAQSESLKIVEALRDLAIRHNIALLLVEHVSKMKHEKWEPMQLDDVYGAGVKSADQVFGISKIYREIVAVTYDKFGTEKRHTIKKPYVIHNCGLLTPLKWADGVNKMKFIIRDKYFFERGDTPLEEMTVADLEAESQQLYGREKIARDRADAWLGTRTGTWTVADLISDLEITFDQGTLLIEIWEKRGDIKVVDEPGVWGHEIKWQKKEQIDFV